MKICVVGMFRSGTNLLKAALEHNFVCDVNYDQFGWKHAFFPIVSSASPIPRPITPHIAITKEPYSLLYSFYKYTRGNTHNAHTSANDGMSMFLRSEVVVHDGPLGNGAEYYFSSPVEYYNSMVWNLLSSTRCKSYGFHLRYEDLMSSPSKALSGIADHLGLERLQDEVSLPEKRLAKLGSGEQNKEKFFENTLFDRSVVTRRSYLSEFCDEDLHYIKENLSQRLIRDLGYEEYVSI